MYLKKIFCVSIIILITITANLSASSNAGRAGALFLKLGGSPRSLAMGNVYAAIPEAVNSAYGNPAAALLNLKSPEFHFIHNKWLMDIDYNYLGYAQTINNASGLAVGLLHLDYGSFIGYDAAGNKIADPKARDRAYTFTSSLVLSPQIVSGVTIKYITGNYEMHHAEAFALDAGVIIKTHIEELKLGAVIQNAGTKIKFVKEKFSLPLTYKIGAAYSYLDDLVVVGIDFAKANYSDITFNIGAEWRCYHNLIVRAGYNSEFDIGSGFSAGFGADFEKWQFDYAYLPFGELGSTHRFSLIYRFKIQTPKKIKF